MDELHPLRRWRAENEVTLDSLSKDLGVFASHLSQVERGLRGVSMELAFKIEDKTGIPARSLLRGEAAA